MTKHTLVRFREFLVKYFKKRGIPHAEAEELTQEVFIIAYEKRLPSLEEDWGRASLTLIAKFEVLNWHRSHKRRGRALAKLSSSCIDTTSSRFEPQLSARLFLEQNFRRLSAHDQAVLLAVALEPNVAKLSRALGVNYNQLHKSIFRARSKLAELE